MTPPPAAATGRVLERGPRATGRSPIALWFTRSAAADPVEVTLRLIDPLGRTTERRITVPGWVPPPSHSVAITNLIERANGVLAIVDTDAPTTEPAGIVLQVRALQRRLPIPLGPPTHPFGSLVVVASANFTLAEIGAEPTLFPNDDRIHGAHLTQVRADQGGH